MSENIEYDFELDLEFQGNKNPSEAFSQLAKFYEKLIVFDKHITYNILISTKIEYDLVDVEFGSIKTKIRQVFTSLPDDVLKDVLNPTAWLGHLLVYVKYRILKAVESKEVDSKQALDKLTKEINKEVKRIVPINLMVLEVNNYYILNTINDITIQAKKLKKEEAFYFKSKKGKAKVNNKSFLDMPKILKEMGDETIQQERIEILKIRTLDLLSDNTYWKLIREGKIIDVKILDASWLDDYHNRKLIIQPNDYLKLLLKIIYTTNPNFDKPKISYEVLKVYSIIPPNEIEDNGQIDVFGDDI
jgi:hypothetical protein